MDIRETDVAVVGAGLAGLSAALAARGSGRRVLVVSESSDSWASARSGGNFRAPSDTYSPEQYFLDIIAGGGYLAQRSLAKALATDAALARGFVEGAGVAVTAGRTGFTVDGANEAPGKALLRGLGGSLRKAGVETTEAFAWDLLTRPDGRVVGLLAYDPRKATWLAVAARAVILATGGAASVYLRSDNSQDATGDGIAMAYRAGAVLADMEFVQFWPLAEIRPDGWVCLGPGALASRRLILNGKDDITERCGLRGLIAGARSQAEVARLIYQEAGLGAEDPAKEPVLQLVPSSQSRGEGAATIEVTPSAHHTIGGVVCGDHGQTRVPGLFVAGETVAGSHGAARLSGNGLTEAVVTGRRAGRLAGSEVPGGPRLPAERADFERQAHEHVRRTMALFTSAEAASLSPSEAARRVRQAMWRSAALVRSRDSLDAAQSTLNKVKRALPLMVDHADGASVRAGLKTLNLLLVAEAIARSARFRRESRGVHFRVDYPGRDDAEWLRHVRVRQLSGEMSLDTSQGLEPMEP